MVECSELDSIVSQIEMTDIILNKRPYLGMSEIGEKCERKLWYKFRQFSENPLPLRIKSLFNLGSFIEKEIIECLESQNFKIDCRQQEISIFNGDCKGHIDGRLFIPADNKYYILECKSINKKYFNSIKKEGLENFPYYEKYLYQLISYMGNALFDGHKIYDSLLVFYCKDDSKLLMFDIEFDYDLFFNVEKKINRILYSIEEPEIQPNINCDWCDYKALCKYKEEYLMEETDKCCRNCHYFGFVGLTKYCLNEKHYTSLSNSLLKCPDYHYMFDKREAIDKKIIG